MALSGQPVYAIDDDGGSLRRHLSCTFRKVGRQVVVEGARSSVRWIKHERCIIRKCKWKGTGRLGNVLIYVYTCSRVN
jgi:hypothetical protein